LGTNSPPAVVSTSLNLYFQKRHGIFGARPPDDLIEGVWGKKIVRWIVWGLILVLIALLFYRYRNILLGKVSDQPVRYRIDRNYTDEKILSKSNLEEISPEKQSLSSSVSFSPSQANPLKDGESYAQKEFMRGYDRVEEQVEDVSSKQNILSQDRMGLSTRLLFRRVTGRDLDVPLTKKGKPDTETGIKEGKGSFYSLILSSHLSRDNAMAEVSVLKRGKLFPIFLKKMSAHGKVWWVIFQGTYENRKMAEEVKALYHFSSAIVRKVRVREMRGALAFLGHEDNKRYCLGRSEPVVSRGYEGRDDKGKSEIGAFTKERQR